jgi:hypothetical protein
MVLVDKIGFFFTFSNTFGHILYIVNAIIFHMTLLTIYNAFEYKQI